MHDSFLIRLFIVVLDVAKLKEKFLQLSNKTNDMEVLIAARIKKLETAMENETMHFEVEIEELNQELEKLQTEMQERSPMSKLSRIYLV